MTDMIPFGGGESPFDVTKRTDEHGEYWSARDLMPLVEYPRWEDFHNVIERARVAIQQSGGDPDREASERPEAFGRTRQRGVNFRLTRHGAYMVMLECDGRKPAVSAAKSYFAVKTREAETAQVAQIPDLSALSAGGLEWLGQLGRALTTTTAELSSARRELESARPKVEYVDQFVSDKDRFLFRTVANQLGIKEQELRDLCLDHDWIYTKPHQRWSDKRGELVTELSYHAKASHKHWFVEKDQPRAPRYANGDMRTTLCITALGKTSLLRLFRESGAA